MPKLICPDGPYRILHPVHPNAGIEMGYRSRLDTLVTRMHNSVYYWVVRKYHANPPVLAQDSPASDLIKELRGLGQRWRRAFARAADELAGWFSKTSAERADGSLKTVLRDAGWTVRFKSTPAWNDIRRATIEANVSLIRSIGEQHLREVEGLVMRSVQQGGDLATLTQALEKRYGITRRRASLIARDQNNKATAAITRVRQQELGIEQAIWVHSHAGREPRPSHVAYAAGRLGGPIYDISKGAPLADDGGMTWPGVEINCRCISRSIIPGLGV